MASSIASSSQTARSVLQRTSKRSGCLAARRSGLAQVGAEYAATSKPSSMRSSGSRQAALSFQRAFASSSKTALKARGIVYEKNGDPRELVRGHTWELPAPQNGDVVLRMGLGSINPADINVVQGVYPARPSMRQLPGLTEPVFVGGNEGFGIVEEVHGAGGKAGLKQGDWVVFGQPQMGTWTSHMVCPADHVVKVEREHGNPGSAQHRELTDVMASTLQVNPATAYRMLHDFVTLDPQRDIVIQNTANSSVGQAVAQIASRALGVESINLLRGGSASKPRQDMDELTRAFSEMHQGASNSAKAHLFTYEKLADKESGTKERIKEILNSGGQKRSIKLGLNALCGPDNVNMVKLLGIDATLVTYGAMSKQPLAIPAGLVIFNNLTSRGFMMNKWYAQHGLSARQELMRQLVAFYEDGTLDPPPATIIEMHVNDSPDDMTQKARKAIAQSMGGYGGRKFFFKFVS